MLADDFARFLELKARFQRSNALVQSFLLEESFPTLEQEMESPAVKAAIRKFMDEQIAERSRRHEANMARYRRQHEAMIEKVMRTLREWSLGSVPASTASGLVRASAWWLTHASGRAVRAPGHADRIEERSCGWAIEFGANHFLIGRAVQGCAKELIEMMDAVRRHELLNRRYVRSRLRPRICESVANYNLDRYDHYPPEGDQLVFGAQAISLSNSADYVARSAGFDQFIFQDEWMRKSKPLGGAAG